MKTIYNKFDKKLIPALPRALFGGRIIVIQTEAEADKAVSYFRLNRIGVPDSVRRLLQDERVMKVGLSLRDDFASLHKRGAFEPHAFLELQDYVKAFGIQDMSLQKLYANIFGQKISKGQRLTNWEADVLTEGQKLYAATDAWACIRLYRELESLKANHGYTLAVVPEPGDGAAAEA